MSTESTEMQSYDAFQAPQVDSLETAAIVESAGAHLTARFSSLRSSFRLRTLGVACDADDTVSVRYASVEAMRLRELEARTAAAEAAAAAIAVTTKESDTPRWRPRSGVTGGSSSARRRPSLLQRASGGNVTHRDGTGHQSHTVSTSRGQQQTGIGATRSGSANRTRKGSIATVTSSSESATARRKSSIDGTTLSRSHSQQLTHVSVGQREGKEKNVSVPALPLTHASRTGRATSAGTNDSSSRAKSVTARVGVSQTSRVGVRESRDNATSRTVQSARLPVTQRLTSVENVSTSPRRPSPRVSESISPPLPMLLHRPLAHTEAFRSSLRAAGEASIWSLRVLHSARRADCVRFCALSGGIVVTAGMLAAAQQKLMIQERQQARSHAGTTDSIAHTTRTSVPAVESIVTGSYRRADAVMRPAVASQSQQMIATGRPAHTAHPSTHTPAHMLTNSGAFAAMGLHAASHMAATSRSLAWQDIAAASAAASAALHQRIVVVPLSESASSHALFPLDGVLTLVAAQAEPHYDLAAFSAHICSPAVAALTSACFWLAHTVFIVAATVTTPDTPGDVQQQQQLALLSLHVPPTKDMQELNEDVLMHVIAAQLRVVVDDAQTAVGRELFLDALPFVIAHAVTTALPALFPGSNDKFPKATQSNIFRFIASLLAGISLSSVACNVAAGKWLPGRSIVSSTHASSSSSLSLSSADVIPAKVVNDPTTQSINPITVANLTSRVEDRKQTMKPMTRPTPSTTGKMTITLPPPTHKQIEKTSEEKKAVANTNKSIVGYVEGATSHPITQQQIGQQSAAPNTTIPTLHLNKMLGNQKTVLTHFEPISSTVEAVNIVPAILTTAPPSTPGEDTIAIKDHASSSNTTTEDVSKLNQQETTESLAENTTTTSSSLPADSDVFLTAVGIVEDDSVEESVDQTEPLATARPPIDHTSSTTHANDSVEQTAQTTDDSTETESKSLVPTTGSFAYGHRVRSLAADILASYCVDTANETDSTIHEQFNHTNTSSATNLSTTVRLLRARTGNNAIHAEELDGIEGIDDDDDDDDENSEDDYGNTYHNNDANMATQPHAPQCTHCGHPLFPLEQTKHAPNNISFASTIEGSILDEAIAESNTASASPMAAQFTSRSNTSESVGTVFQSARSFATVHDSDGRTNESKHMTIPALSLSRTPHSITPTSSTSSLISAATASATATASMTRKSRYFEARGTSILLQLIHPLPLLLPVAAVVDGNMEMALSGHSASNTITDSGDPTTFFQRAHRIISLAKYERLSEIAKSIVCTCSEGERARQQLQMASSATLMLTATSGNRTTRKHQLTNQWNTLQSLSTPPPSTHPKLHRRSKSCNAVSCVLSLSKPFQTAHSRSSMNDIETEIGEHEYLQSIGSQSNSLRNNVNNQATYTSTSTISQQLSNTIREQRRTAALKAARDQLSEEVASLASRTHAVAHMTAVVERDAVASLMAERDELLASGPVRVAHAALEMHQENIRRHVEASRAANKAKQAQARYASRYWGGGAAKGVDGRSKNSGETDTHGASAEEEAEASRKPHGMAVLRRGKRPAAVVPMIPVRLLAVAAAATATLGDVTDANFHAVTRSAASGSAALNDTSNHISGHGSITSTNSSSLSQGTERFGATAQTNNVGVTAMLKNVFTHTRALVQQQEDEKQQHQYDRERQSTSTTTQSTGNNTQRFPRPKSGATSRNSTDEKLVSDAVSTKPTARTHRSSQSASRRDGNNGVKQVVPPLPTAILRRRVSLETLVSTLLS